MADSNTCDRHKARVKRLVVQLNATRVRLDAAHARLRRAEQGESFWRRRCQHLAVQLKKLSEEAYERLDDSVFQPATAHFLCSKQQNGWGDSRNGHARS